MARSRVSLRNWGALVGTDFGGEMEGAPDEGGFEGELTQWSGLPEDLAELVSKKGWAGPADALKSYAELERDRSRILSERDNLVEAYQTAEDWQEPTPQSYGADPNAMDPMDLVGRLGAAVDNGQVEFGQAFAMGMSQIVPQIVEAELAKRLSPVENRLTERELRERAQSIRGQFQEAGYGDIAPQLAAEAAKLARPGSMYDSPEGMEAAMAIAFMRHRLSEDRTKRVRDRSQTADQGGRVAAQRQNMAEDFKKFLLGDG